MKAADLLIIYFALGSPFAVYAVTGRHLPLSPGQYLLILARVVLWPLVAGAYFIKWLISDEALDTTLRQARIKELRDQLETAAFYGHSSPALFEFRDMFERYASLTLSLDFDPYSHPLLGLSAHTSKLAAAAIYRRERERIKFHQERARSEFAAFVRALCESKPKSKFASISIEVAELLEDEQMTAELSALCTTGTAGPVSAAKPVIRNAEH